MVLGNYCIAIFIFLCVLSITFNFITVVIICCSHRLREIIPHILKVSLALADLGMGILHLAFYSRLAARSEDQWCFQNTPVETVAELLGYFVVGWTLVTLNLMTIYKKRAKTCCKFMSALIKLGRRRKYLCVLPWFVGSCVAVPVVMTSAAEYDLPHVDEVICIAYMPEPILITFSFIALHLPCYLSVAYLFTIVACHCRTCHGTQPPANVHDSARETVHNEDNVSLSGLLPVIFYVTCLLPLVVYTWAWFIYGYPATEPVSTTVTFCLLTRSIAQSVSWLGCRDLRVEIVRVGRCVVTEVGRLCRHRETSTQTFVSYDVLHESQIL